MKIYSDSFAETDGIEASEIQTSTIKATGKGFSILIDKLYSEKIDSVVREICSNAYDAHVSAGKPDVPFDIIMPNRIEPTLIVRDEGIGLSPERVFKLFGTVFESTKENSNSDIGAFGLGSKSPYSITDQYTIESRFNGTLYTFLAFKNDQGVPSMLKTNEEPTDDVNGITVHVPIDDKHIFDVQKAVKRQLLFFPTKPTFAKQTALAETFWPKTEAIKVFKSLLFKGAPWGGHRVRMGPVSYPLDLTQIESEVAKKLASILGGHSNLLITEFPMGSLDLQPSREGLSYIPETKRVLNEYFAEMVTSFEQEVNAQYAAAATSLFDAYEWVSQERNRNPYVRMMSFTYEGEDVDPEDRYGHDDKLLTFSYVEQTETREWVERVVKNKDTMFDEHGLENPDWVEEFELVKRTSEYTNKYPPYGCHTIRQGAGSGRSNSNGSAVWPRDRSYFNGMSFYQLKRFRDPAAKFIWIDSGEDLSRRLKYAASQNGLSVYFGNAAIRNKDETSLDNLCENIAIIMGCKPEDIKAKFTMSSSLPKPPVEKKFKVERKAGQLLACWQHGNHRVKGQQILDTDELKKFYGCPYIVIERGVHTDRYALDRYSKLVRTGQDIVVVSKTATADQKMLRAEGLVPFEDWLKSILENHAEEFFKVVLHRQVIASNKLIDLPSTVATADNPLVKKFVTTKRQIRKASEEASGKNNIYDQILECFKEIQPSGKMPENLFLQHALKNRQAVKQIRELHGMSRRLMKDPLIMVMSKMGHYAELDENETKSVLKYLNTHFNI